MEDSTPVSWLEGEARGEGGDGGSRCCLGDAMLMAGVERLLLVGVAGLAVTTERAVQAACLYNGDSGYIRMQVALGCINKNALVERCADKYRN